MGSPDPDGRQIDGLGGGVSSLSKVAVLNAPGRGRAGTARKCGNAFPGVEWSESYESSRREHGWDVVYRFGQVPINGTTIDWGSTCGNLVAAVAHHSFLSQIITRKQIDDRALTAGIDTNNPQAEFMMPIRILTANNGNRVTARLPLIKQNQHWMLPQAGECSIAGVPGSASPVVVETPLDSSALLPTGNVKDEVQIGDRRIPVTIIDAGLPVIFVDSSSLDVELDHLISHPASLDADTGLMHRIEELRQVASSLTSYLTSLYFPGSASPKVCLLHERMPYMTTSGDNIASQDYDCLIRAVSVGQFHRTVPATTLSALGVASAFTGSLVSDVIARGQDASTKTAKPIAPWVAASAGSDTSAKVSCISVGQPAGISSTYFRIPSGSQSPDAIIMERTARLLMDGEIQFPSRCAQIHQPYIDDVKSRQGKIFPPTKNFVDTPGDPWYNAVNKAVEALGAEDRMPYEIESRQQSSIETHATPGSRREFSSSARQHRSDKSSSSRSTTSSPNPFHLYRHLTRAVQRHNSLPHPHRSNLRRVFRDDFRTFLNSEERNSPDALDALSQRVERTLLMLLSASYLNEDEKVSKRSVRPLDGSTPRARQLLTNLGSLTYHHLSPMTPISPKRAPRLVGGSDNSSARANRSRMSLSPTMNTKASMMIMGQGEDDDDDFSTMAAMSGSQRPLTPLMAPPRPRRGPITAQSLVPWDGQRPDKLLMMTQGKILTQKRTSDLSQSLSNLQDQMHSTEFMKRPQKERKAIQEQYKSTRGMLKGIKSMEKREAAQKETERQLKSRLTDLIQGVESTFVHGQQRPGMLCGASRWKKWERSEWIAP
ncbi:unnamed protein product [Sympodiomycopsis kandeliae]